MARIDGQDARCRVTSRERIRPAPRGAPQVQHDLRLGAQQREPLEHSSACLVVDEARGVEPARTIERAPGCAPFRQRILEA
jgi:hypothetical protein